MNKRLIGDRRSRSAARQDVLSLFLGGDPVLQVGEETRAVRHVFHVLEHVFDSVRCMAREVVHRVFRFRFYPTDEQAARLCRTLGCVRLVYNKALEARSTAWVQEQRRVNYVETSALLTAWKQ